MSHQSPRSPPRSLDLVARTRSWVSAVSGQGQDSFVLVPLPSPLLLPAAPLRLPSCLASVLSLSRSLLCALPFLSGSARQFSVYNLLC